MFYSYTDDPLADLDSYELYLDKEEREYRSKCAICECCNRHITDGEAFYIFDQWICEECMDNFRADPYLG